MARRWRLIFWRWVHRLHDQLHRADTYADSVTDAFAKGVTSFSVRLPKMSDPEPYWNTTTSGHHGV
jgi:hypothetical protein